MNLPKVYQRMKSILFQPHVEWELIRKESLSHKEIIRGFSLPLSIFTAVAAFVGGLIFHSGYGFSTAYILSYTLIAFVVPLGTSYLSSLVIYEISVNFDCPKNLHLSTALVSYSFTAFYISYSAARLLDLFPMNTLFSLFGLFSFYIFWQGSGTILNIPETKRISFTIFSALIILGIYISLSLFLKAIFGSALEGGAIL